ncbi:unnamed protein product [Prunus brigantina]
MCARSKMIIPRLLKRIDVVEGELRRSRSRDRLLWAFILAIRIIFAFLLVASDEENASTRKKATLELACCVYFCVLYQTSTREGYYGFIL